MARPATIDAYLAGLPDESRAALEKVRKAIVAAAPKAQECFSYGLPAFRDDGGLLAGFGASAKHCAYYPMSGSVVSALAGALEGYATSKGAIRFDASQPLPATLVRQLVRARQAENVASATQRRAAAAPVAERATAAKRSARKAAPAAKAKAAPAAKAKASPAAKAKAPPAAKAKAAPAAKAKAPPAAKAKAPPAAKAKAARAAKAKAAPAAKAKASPAAKRAQRPASAARAHPPDVAALLAELERAGSSQFRSDMSARYGIVTKAPAFGTPMAKLKPIARRLARDHALAEALWKTGIYEARLLAALVDEPERVTRAQMDRWARDFDNWATVDTVCFNLFDRTPHVFAQAASWARSGDEFVKRAAFALLASAALHGHGTDADFTRALPLVVSASDDERNFVKKGVSWALRAIGIKAGPKARAQARALAQRLASSEGRAARWIGKDALGEFAKRA
jgi:3-methyladenine DNA glycosylase AlkD/uncharacterized protein YdhG (YjbR/CyaY superfamily)